MNIKKKAPAGECYAKRCNVEAVATVPGICFDLKADVPLCQRHTDTAIQEFGLVGDLAEAVVYLDQPAPDPDATPDVVEVATPEVVVPEKELAEEEAEAKDALAVVQDLTIQTQEDLDFANETLKEVKGRAKKLKTRLDEITKPLNSALKSARDLFRPAMNYYDEIEKELKNRIGEHKLRQDEANRAAMLAAAAAAEAGDNTAAADALANVTTIGDAKGLSTRQTWGYIIEDASLLPREFLMPNEQAIGAHARAAKAGAPAAIPGVRFVPKVIVSSRAAG